LIPVGDIEFLRGFVDHHVGGAADLAGRKQLGPAPETRFAEPRE
jgi:hypothetical protein